MRILFDGRGVREQSDGLGNYVRRLLTALLSIDETNEYIVLMNRTLADDLARANLLDRPNLRPVVTSTPFMGAAQQLQIPRLARRLGPVSVYHYPHFDLPVFAHPRSVVTIYDLNHLSFPEYFDSFRPLKRLYSFQTTRWTIAKATEIITISNTTKSHLLQRFPWLDPRKVTVIYFGANEAFRTPPDPERLRAFRRKFQLGDGRFILYVGTHRAHKNLTHLLEAYRRLSAQSASPHELLLVGAPKDDGDLRAHIAALGLSGRVKALGHIADEEMPLAYRVADVFAFCSLSEGFGMPLLDAMVSGVPIVTSNLGAMAEVVGDSAVLVDPFTVESIADGLMRVLESEALRHQLIALGLERATHFTWEAAARKTLELYARASGAAPTALDGAAPSSSDAVAAVDCALR